MDNFTIAMSRFRRRRFDESVELCNDMLANNPSDQGAWLLKCHCLIKKNYLDDIEIDEDGAGDILLDDNETTNVARPGTSFNRPTSQRQQTGQNPSQMVRPMSKSGRPMSGVARPGTNNRPTSSSRGMTGRVQTALRNRTGTSRPITTGGRFVRLGTASIQQTGGEFLDSGKLNMKKIAKNKSMARAVCDYLIYVEHNPKRALELAAEATVLENYNDWWWKERLGKCYFQLGLLRDAEKQFNSSMKTEDIISAHLQLARVYIKLDQPNTALDIYSKAMNKYPTEISFVIGQARIHDMLNDSAKSVELYRRALAIESSNLESVASIACYHFYMDQPEIALRFYSRLVQLGVNTAELWNNLGLCCFYDGQYDMFFSCFEKALNLATDETLADVWYNLGQVCIAIGDMNSAFYAFKLALSYDSHHAESYSNLGVLELKRGKPELARYNFQIAMKEADYLFEPVFNQAIRAFQSNDYQEAYKLAKRALEIFPDHNESKSLMKEIESILRIM